MNLYEKLVEVRKEIDFLKKDTKGYNYNYVSGSQVLAKVKNKMDNLGLVLVPSVDHQNSKYEIFQYDSQVKDRSGNVSTKHNINYIVNAPMTYTWINAEAPEERLEIPWSLYGQQEEISKALGSGLTYSERYFLTKFFSIPTDDLDPDTKQEYIQENNENKTDKKDDKKTETINKAKAAAAAKAAEEEILNNDPISGQQAKTLLMLSNGDVDLCKNVIKSFGYEMSAEIINKDFPAIYNAIKAAVIKKGGVGF